MEKQITKDQIMGLINEHGAEKYLFVLTMLIVEGGPITFDRLQKGLVNFDSIEVIKMPTNSFRTEQ